MKLQALCIRNTKEILRDPVNLGFGLGFPVVLLLLLSAIQANIPVRLFEIKSLAPGVSVFALSFLTLFSATLIAKDRESALLWRLYTAPLSPWHFILGYAIPMLPIGLAQGAVCYITAFALGLNLSINILLALLLLIPPALFFIFLGLLCGSVLNVKQAGGLCGALFTNLTAWLSGVWFDLNLVGEGFKKIAYALPFVHAVELERSAVSGEFADIFSYLLWVLAYALIIGTSAVIVFLKQAKKM